MTSLLILFGAFAASHLADSTPATALVHVTLIDGRGGPPLPDATIIIRDGRIESVGAGSSVPIPIDSRILDLRDRVATPGFIDMHYHVTTGAMRYRRNAAGVLDSTYDSTLAKRLLLVALSRGITTIRDPGASPLELAVALREDVARGRVLGPRILTAGPMLTSPHMSENEIRSAVRSQVNGGANYIKLYAGITAEQLRVAVGEAHRQKVQVIGHLQRTSWTKAAESGIDFITHGANWHEDYLPTSRRERYRALGGGMRARIAWLEWLEIYSPSVDSMLRALQQGKVSIDPTLVAYHTKFWWGDSLYQRDPDSALVPELLFNWRVLGMPTADWTADEFARVQRVWPKQLALVRRLHQAGIRLTVGSDVASPWVIPGVAFHQELALLASAGLSSGEILTMATRNGAEALGLLHDVGTIEPGKRADLVVLSGHPLKDIRKTRLIEYVVLGGMVYRPTDFLSASTGSKRKDR